VTTTPGIATTVVGSYPQPDWLIDRAALRGRLPARVRAHELWRVAPELLEQAQDDATELAIRDMEQAAIDVLTDGEIRRESYSNRFATALEGIDVNSPGQAMDRTGHMNPVPRIVGPVRWQQSVLVRDLTFLRAQTRHRVKVTLPGPFTMTQQAQDDFYHDEEALAMAFADAVNAEVKALYAAGADLVQLDEPYLEARPEKARAYAVDVVNRALTGVTQPTALHLCFGYGHLVPKPPDRYTFLAELTESLVSQISIEAAQPRLDLSTLRDLDPKTITLGVLDLADPEIETPDVVARRLEAALKYVPHERLIAAPDCGMKYLTRDVTLGKLRSLAAGARLVGQASA
jgi:5-methyltetrahydropteroyltriglutamate--homocysteine methyltransferase